MMGGFGAQEIVIILLIVVVLFGAKRLPGIGKGIGSALQEFKKAKKGLDREVDDVLGDSVKK